MTQTLSRRKFVGDLSLFAAAPFLSFGGGKRPSRQIGFTRFRTNLPGGRQPNIRTMQACIVDLDTRKVRELAPDLGARPNSWTQFAGWSPDGRWAILGSGWESPENAAWEEEHKNFRMTEGWRYDTLLLDPQTGERREVTAEQRVSEYNSGLFFWPNNPKRLGFTALVAGISHPFSMDLDGGNKTDLSEGEGFSYGFNASPDGKRIAYHKDYQIHLANADGSGATRIDTGLPFNFSPQWSPDGAHVVFVAGEHYDCHPHVVAADGTGLRKLADRGGYSGVMEILDVPDFHGGSSDVPIWAPDGKSVYYTSKIGESVELMRVDLGGNIERLTRSKRPGTHYYHPSPTRDGKYLACGSTRSGARDIVVFRVGEWIPRPMTQSGPGWGAMWPSWRPA